MAISCHYSDIVVKKLMSPLGIDPITLWLRCGSISDYATLCGSPVRGKDRELWVSQEISGIRTMWKGILVCRKYVCYCWVKQGTWPAWTEIYSEARKSVNCLLKCTLKYNRNNFLAYWIYKNCSKWEPACLAHKLQGCDTVPQVYLEL
jgi:hypothetical protein